MIVFQKVSGKKESQNYTQKRKQKQNFQAPITKSFSRGAGS
jgi:hypothetical protein